MLGDGGWFIEGELDWFLELDEDNVLLGKLKLMMES